MIRAVVQKDLGQLIRFAIVGVSVAAIYVLLFLGFLHVGLVAWLANALAFGLAVLVQYVGQTVWTFRQKLGQPDQALRFGCTIGLGFVASGLLTGVIGPMLSWPDWLAASTAAVWLPVQNYLFFKIWVYAGNGA
ncbi:GtrA family protein [Phaeobacter gallaeciensis]|uniref:Polysaccharide biosynthesis protein n=1 Tax=Phaeobacter gallaeciensis TaxID=60890 RepID=A0AAD0EAA7_9RHOB|nr:GtrA family protein [Phaeobacter gallaeciensis]AHD08428.1 putative membrane protein [Phaeobacter gallaeciensis DSM 26640]ATE91694.1 putative polysaccharide biosynthesis protein [Phaeobacter gallaeciensis]ATE98482.1 putative polysaccharide biosynthesis protein [Phaeobacter gallaeciensis]ATF00310.1 putative polysaccharide biosynthesis protein [Phaeobacter gallaeciensis]ATF04742.1 putative polysaccharide biosynthesis protein [Phaeobacter gallaeciensis]